MKFFVTGHTGFKGSWLTMLLKHEGHEVYGYSLPKIQGSLYDIAHLDEVISKSTYGDIRNKQLLEQAISEAKPDVVVHLAAQALVLESYRDPLTTYSTNVDGTLNLLDAVRKTPSVNACLIITTDKVYRNTNKESGYDELDPLGGDDPYSSSKAMSDILAQSWSISFQGAPVGILRAGNVIGGGDISADRLLPDLIRGINSAKPLLLRNPGSIRPWQHVLDCLSGYVLTAESLCANPRNEIYNFGPPADNFSTVREVAEAFIQYFDKSPSQLIELAKSGPKESEVLKLNSQKARDNLGWRDKLSLSEAIEFVANFELRMRSGTHPRDILASQISEFLNK